MGGADTSTCCSYWENAYEGSARKHIKSCPSGKQSILKAVSILLFDTKQILNPLSAVQIATKNIVLGTKRRPIYLYTIQHTASIICHSSYCCTGCHDLTEDKMIQFSNVHEIQTSGVISFEFLLVDLRPRFYKGKCHHKSFHVTGPMSMFYQLENQISSGGLLSMSPSMAPKCLPQYH